MEQQPKKDDNALFKCEFCGKQSGTKSGLTRHVDHVHGGKKIKEAAPQPAHCNKASNHDNSKVMSTGECDNASLKDEECDKVSADTAKCSKLSSVGHSSNCDPIVNLLKGLDLGSGNPSDLREKSSLVCEICGKKDILSKGGLTRHLKAIHKITRVPENSLMCNLCDKICSTQSGLTRHKDKVHQTSFNIRTK